MESSTHLALPYIMPSQAQKHVTHNEAIAMLDALVQLSVIDRDLTAPPGGESEGDRYIVAATATGDWAGKEDDVAVYRDGAWLFLTPRTGWVAWVADEAQLCYWTGSAWADVAAALTALQNLALLGVGTMADATNPFSAKLNKALWTAKTAAEGGDGDLRYTMNKETTADVLSILMQTGFSGRAELGLIGDDDLTLKVSADGSVWTTAVVVDAATGRLRMAIDDIGTDVGALAIEKTGNSGNSIAIVQTLGNAPVRIRRLSNSTTAGAQIVGERASATGGQVQADWILTGLLAQGMRDTAAMSPAVGEFAFRAAETFIGTANGTYFVVATTPIGSATRVERLRISNAGDLQMGGANTVIDASRRFIVGASSEFSAASIASIGHAVNTTGKLRGLIVWDTTNNRALRASGTAAGDAWQVLDGSATVTPA
ncbi:DUF2793 domain-containing protein [Aquibium sp. LZ166]|uniref:DUF2793 domain-containing protein n=1 Tax=Aquibium pacificus TaxID=3153579 RepID=A0ABV3SSA6_9HYPH